MFFRHLQCVELSSILVKRSMNILQRKRVKLLRLCHSQLEKIVGETAIRYQKKYPYCNVIVLCIPVDSAHDQHFSPLLVSLLNFRVSFCWSEFHLAFGMLVGFSYHPRRIVHLYFAAVLGFIRRHEFARFQAPFHYTHGYTMLKQELCDL